MADANEGMSCQGNKFSVTGSPLQSIEQEGTFLHGLTQTYFRVTQ